MIDFIFIEFYIKKKYSQKVHEYFGVTKQVITDWRRNNSIPGVRLKQFLENEGEDINLINSMLNAKYFNLG